MSDTAKHGEELYIEAKCQKCHGIDMEYEAKNDKIKTKHDLANWVKGCANNFNVGWFPKENQAVIKYIDEIYYNLEQ
jgi:mono/diheme cytochrome c family protein